MKQKLLLTITLWLTLLGSAWAQSNALHFSNSTKNRVDIGAFAAGSPNFSQGFTFAGWVKFDQFKDLARVFTFAPSASDGSNNLMLCASGTTGLLMAEVNVAKVTTSTALQTNKWYFLTLTVTSSGLTTIYVDGVSVASKTLTAPTNVTRNTCYLGNSSYDEARGLNGSLDEVSIWSRALSAAEIGGIMNGISSPASQTGLLAYYKFNQGTAGGNNTGINTLTDATTNAKHGTLKDFALSGTTSNWVAGYTPPTPPAANNALHFDGTNDYVDLPDFTTSHDFSQGFTFTAWIKWDALTGNARLFEIGNGSSSLDNSIILRINGSGVLVLQCSNGTTNSEIVTNAAVVTTGTWHHVATTISSAGAATIYVDGTAVKSGSVSAPKNVTRANNWLGKSAWTADNYFKGTMDEVSIWHKTLTLAEIANIKQTTPTGNEDKLVAYYNFNQGTAAGTNTGITALTDATANAKHGTLKDFALSGTTSNWVVGFVPATTPTYHLSATPTTLTLDAASGSNGSIAITSNTSWTISGSADWLQLSTTSGSNNGTVTFTTKSANTQAIARVAKYTISGSGVTPPVTFTVTQNSPEQSIMSISVFRGPHSYHYGNTTLSKFFSAFSYGLQEVTAIDIRSGDFTSADWEWMKANRENFTNLNRFAILSTVNSAADVPTGIAGDPIFNTSIKELHLAKVLNIGANAFGSLSKLTTIGLPNVTNIQTSAFNNCSNLYNLMLGATPPIVAANAFSGCPSTNFRRLAFSDANGTLLTGTALNNARTTYNAVNDGYMNDNQWYGWLLMHQPYILSVNCDDENGFLTAENPNAMVFGGYHPGASITVTPTPHPRYKLSSGSPRAYKTDDQSVEVTITNGTFTMPNYDVTVTASFEPKLSVSSTTVTLGKEAGQSQMVTVKSDNEWTLTGTTPEWLSVSATNGPAGSNQIQFTSREANPWAFEREVTFTLTAAEANDVSITVKQEAAEAQTSFSSTLLELAWQQGSTATVELKSNEKWHVVSDAPFNFDITPESGQGDATLTITTLTDNNNSSNISGEIKINNHVINLSQKFNAKQLSVSQTDILVGKEAGSTVQVQVTSNTDWWFDNTNEHFYFEPASGTGNATVTITANGAVSGYRNNVSTPLLTAADAYPVQLTITQKSDYMPLGDGTAANPFQISTLDNLRWMSENLTNESPYLSSHYALTNDIDAQATHNWSEGFKSISNNINSFAGTFNGKGYAISNLVSNYGLFFQTAPEARIDSLALVNTQVKVSGAGGLVCQNKGTINACYVTGYMAGEYVGMLTYSNSGTITSCYTSGFIAGSISAGLCYANLGTISGSYTAVGSLNDMDNDGFVWQNHGSSHGYFNKELFAINRTPTAIGLTTAEMQQQAKFEGWDFTNVWSITEGKSFPRLQGVYNYPLLLPTYPIDGIPNVPYYANIDIIEMDYPVASVELTKAPEGMELIDRFIDWTPKTGGEYDVTITITDTNGKAVAYTYTITVELWGSGTEANPYLIHTIAELDYMRNMQPDTYYVLMNDLDFAGTKYAYNPDYPERTGWQPIISAQENKFFSHFNGNGHIIKNLYINQPNRDNLGLFAPCRSATIKNLGLVDVNITGKNYCGGLAGKISYSTITSCYVTGSINGNENIGGLAGSIDNSTFTSCHILGSVKGKNFIGGLVGSSNSSSTTAQCYANATVEGDEAVGGLIGYDSGVSLSNSYAAGTVSGRKHVGGLIGAGENNFTSCYSVSVATDSAAYRGLNGDAYANGLTKSFYLLEGNADVTNVEGTRLTAQQLMQQASFTDWDFTDIWQITEGQTLPRLRGMYNHPVVLPVADTAQINKPYTHTLRVVGMDNAVASVSISGVEGMTLSETDNTLTWTPANANEPTLTVTATDADGAVTHHRQRIAVIPFNGDGTDDKPYQITTIAQLNAVRNYSNKCFRLMNDLNFDGSEYSEANSQNGWLPIEKFTGKLYGNNHVIKNLYINRLDMKYTGLFGSIENAYITELGLAGVNIQGGNYTGAICGESSNAIIAYCYVSGTIHGSDTNTGGLVGYSQGTTINYSYNTASIYAAGGYLGGIAGVNESSAVISQCYNAGTLYNNEMGYTGAIAGAHGSSTITDCRFDSDINPNIQDCGSVSPNGQTNNTIGLTTEQMKQAANFAEWDFTTLWQIREGQTYPALRTINNAPFAFAEEIHVGARHSLTNLLANDYDYETEQEKLVFRVLSMDGPGAITQNSYFAFPQGTATGTTTKLKYMVGEVTAPGDTLWGGQAVATIKKTENHMPYFTTGNFPNTTYTATINEDEVLTFDLLQSAADDDGDLLTASHLESSFNAAECTLGTPTIDGNNLVFTPNPDAYGTVKVAFFVIDGAPNHGFFPSRAKGIIEITITPVNDAPVLTAVSEKSVNEDNSLTLTLNDVTATDVDGDALSLVIANGENYTVSDNTITPAENFHGTLSVGIAVTDGTLTSNQMVMEITVVSVNDIPVLTAVADLTMNEDESITITMDDVTATDADGDELQIVIDPVIPDVTKKTSTSTKSKNYTVSGNTITPAKDFYGELKVNVGVRDKESGTPPMVMTITVLPVNDAPVLTAVSNNEMFEDESITLTMANVSATDVDGDELQLVIANGENYTVSGNTITPTTGFTGTLSVGISVTDGELTSNQLIMTVTVTALDVNSAPILTAVTNKSIKQGETLTLTMDDVTATDAEGDALQLVIASGNNYTVSGNTITPATGFTGTLSVGISVTDGELTSNQMVMTVTVTALDVNSAPILTAVTNKSIRQGETLTLTMDDVTATDAEGDALQLVIANGNNYTVSGNTITPTTGFTGTLSVGISVTDGELTSNQMVMSVTVTPATGIDDNNTATVSAYPNPFTDYLVVESEEQIRSVSFINLLGKTVQRTSMPETRISTQNLLPGIYLVKVDFAKGKPVVIRMVKQ